MSSWRDERFLEEQYFRQKRELRALNLLFILLSIPFMYSFALEVHSGQGLVPWSLDIILWAGVYWSVLLCFFFIYEYLWLFFTVYAQLAHREFLAELDLMVERRRINTNTSPN